MSTTATLAAMNHWYDARCAKAFWSQGELPAYHELLADTLNWLDPQPGQHWLDLGCGAGRVTAALWRKGGGHLGSVVSLDLADANAPAIAKIAREFDTDRIAFRQGDLSKGLPDFDDSSLDGVVSGLAIQYAEHYCSARNAWTRDAYDHLLADVFRTLKPGGTFVFSVNVPEPNWFRLTLSGVMGLFRSGRPLKYLKNNYRMMRYGSWLKQEARRGRFHYLPEETVRACLRAAGFARIEARKSYSGLAYIFRATRE